MCCTALKNIFIECINLFYNRSIRRGAAKADALNEHLHKYLKSTPPRP